MQIPCCAAATDSQMRARVSFNPVFSLLCPTTFHCFRPAPPTENGLRNLRLVKCNPAPEHAKRNSHITTVSHSVVCSKPLMPLSLSLSLSPSRRTCRTAVDAWNNMLGVDGRFPVRTSTTPPAIFRFLEISRLTDSKKACLCLCKSCSCLYTIVLPGCFESPLIARSSKAKDDSHCTCSSDALQLGPPSTTNLPSPE